MSEAIIFWGLLVIAYVIGMIVSMLGSDNVINDLYGPTDTVRGTNSKKRKTHGI